MLFQLFGAQDRKADGYFLQVFGALLSGDDDFLESHDFRPGGRLLRIRNIGAGKNGRRQRHPGPFGSRTLQLSLTTSSHRAYPSIACYVAPWTGVYATV